jgi:hypothetical protein
MTLAGNTAANPIVVPDSDDETGDQQPPLADTSRDHELALELQEKVHAFGHFPPPDAGRYYDGEPEKSKGRRTLTAGGKAKQRTQTSRSRAHPYGSAPPALPASRSASTARAATPDTRRRPASAPASLASQAQAGPAAPRSASAPPGLVDLGNVAPDLGPTPSLEQSFKAITLLDAIASPSTTEDKSPVPAYLPVVADLSEDQLAATLGIDPPDVNDWRLRRIQQIRLNP